MFLHPLAVSPGVPAHSLLRFGSANIPRQVSAIVRNGAKQAYSGSRFPPKEWAIVQSYNRRFLNQLLQIRKQHPKVFHRLGLNQLGRILGHFAHDLKKSPDSSLVMSIVGPTASGKTTIAQGLHAHLLEGMDPTGVTEPLISQDNFFKDDSKLRNLLRMLFGRDRGDSLFFRLKTLDRPGAFEKELFAEKLAQMKAGKEVRIPKHSFEDSSSKPDAIPVKPGRITLVEGIFPLVKGRELGVTVFIKMQQALRKARWTKRAGEERGITHPAALSALWRKTETGRLNHIAPFEKSAAIVLNNNSSREEMNHAIAVLARGLRKYLVSIRRVVGK
jgi:uridine kinase